MSEEAFDLVKGSLARRKQSATTVMLAEPTPQEIEALVSIAANSWPIAERQRAAKRSFCPSSWRVP